MQVRMEYIDLPQRGADIAIITRFKREKNMEQDFEGALIRKHQLFLVFSYLYCQFCSARTPAFPFTTSSAHEPVLISVTLRKKTSRLYNC